MGFAPRKEKASWVAPAPAHERWHKNNYPSNLLKFYNSAVWRRASKKNLAMNPTCVVCEQEGIVRKADVTDHVIPIRQEGSKMDPRNHQSLCHSHHNAKSASERNGDILDYKIISTGKIPL